MKILKGLLAVVLTLGVVIGGGGFLLPASTHVERSIEIERPPTEVFAMLDSYRRFNEWSPWHGRDPKTVYTYEGPESGVGASLRWSSEQSDVGKGRQTITASEPAQKIVARLEFEGQGDAVATFLLTPTAQGARVTWAFDTDHGRNVVSRWFGLMFDRWIGADYEQGLTKLKSVMEQPAR